jgi:hypothetical protein
MREKCISEQKRVLDITMQAGLICHPTKLKPPTQVQIFYGFLYDSQSTPKLRIPDNKVLWALTLFDFLMIPVPPGPCSDSRNSPVPSPRDSR